MFHTRHFTEARDGEEITYKSISHYLQYNKALKFGDVDRARKILEVRAPRKAKYIGNNVENFDESEWDLVKEDVAVDGLMLKFTFPAAADLRQKLLDTGEKLLVKADPFNDDWGIGYGENVACQYRSRWGNNLLGGCLMEARDRLRAIDMAEENDDVTDGGETSDSSD
ncbi:putative NADAR domain-containing protein [Seiridium cardinale]|uniref:NADAR domain-containing protein n=1 Tax=Seiridium cardinale TaxID=138064 RepID=A0ABR2XGB2_9PEZI